MPLTNFYHLNDVILDHIFYYNSTKHLFHQTQQNLQHLLYHILQKKAIQIRKKVREIYNFFRKYLQSKPSALAHEKKPHRRSPIRFFISIAYFCIAATCFATSSLKSSLFFSRPSPITKNANLLMEVLPALSKSQIFLESSLMNACSSKQFSS